MIVRVAGAKARPPFFGLLLESARPKRKSCGFFVDFLRQQQFQRLDFHG
jgi:hypothetical protein